MFNKDHLEKEIKELEARINHRQQLQHKALITAKNRFKELMEGLPLINNQFNKDLKVDETTLKNLKTGLDNNIKTLYAVKGQIISYHILNNYILEDQAQIKKLKIALKSLV